jgi:hypothetical protein
MARIPPRAQGDAGEFSAMQYFVMHRRAPVYLPFQHSPDVDLVADLGDRLARVQVKTSSVQRDDRWVVATVTRGGNQSWNGVVKRFSPSRCDLLFVAVGDGRRWLIPAGAIDGGTGVTLGGPKYARYEVEPWVSLAELAGAER